MPPTTPLYYECHVTIEPVDPETDPSQYAALEAVVGAYGFKLAKLYMQKGVRSDKDSFCTAHSDCREDIYERMAGVVRKLGEWDFRVRRYKIESVVFDTRCGSEI
jgi:hypothetical protein